MMTSLHVFIASNKLNVDESELRQKANNLLKLNMHVNGFCTFYNRYTPKRVLFLNTVGSACTSSRLFKVNSLPTIVDWILS